MGGAGERRIRVQVIRAWARRFEAIEVILEEGACVADAVAASGSTLEAGGGYAVFGERVLPESTLRDGDRLEVLRPLQVDPKQARRRRAEAARRR